MKKRFLFLVLVSLLMVSCGNDNSKQIAAAKKAEYAKIETAMGFLSDGNYDEAYTQFGYLKNSLVYYKSEAIYGYTWSSMLKYMNDLIGNLTDILNAVSGQLNAGAAKSPAERQKMVIKLLGEYQTQGGGGIIGNAITSLIQGFVKNFNNWDSSIKEIKKIGHLNFKIKSLPVTIMNTATIMDLGGEHDMGEVYFLDASFNLAMAWLNFFDSIDFNINIMDTKLTSYAVNYLFPLFNEKNVKVAPVLMNVITLLLNDNPSLFSLDKNSGTEKTKLARDEFYQTFKSFADTIREIKKEKDDQSDDIIQYKYDKQNNIEYAVFNIKEINLSTSAIPGGDKLGNVTISKTGVLEMNIGPDSKGISMADRLDKIANNFTSGGAPISWAQDIAPIVSSILVMVLNSGMLNSLIQSAISGMGSDNSLGDSLNSIMGSDLINEDLITGILTGFIPDSIQLDFGGFYNNPPNYRDLLPAWTNGLTKEVLGADGKKEVWPADVFMLEYECGDSSKSVTSPTGALGPLLYDDFVCNNKYSLAVSNGPDVTTMIKDTDHFQTTNWIWQRYINSSNGITTDTTTQYVYYIPPIITAGTSDAEDAYQGFTKDGVDSIIPYMYFKDPTFGKLLYIKMSPLGFSEAQWANLEECNEIKDNFGLPNNKCLNAALGKLLSDLINSLNLADSLAIGVTPK